MGTKTKIQWCDSTLNLQMGCNGCELWKKATGIKTCYAGTLVERYKGRKGWPDSFDRPKIFSERIELIDRWPDLTGTDRPDKPWLNGLPRIIFLNDLGDTFTEGLPINWLDPFLSRLKNSPHIYIILSKRVRRMRNYFDRLGYVPKNFWLMTTITNRASLPRLGILQGIKDAYGAFVGVSIEPMLSAMNLPPDFIPDWVIIGGESGSNARPFDLAWLANTREECERAQVPLFVKQLGDNIVLDGIPIREYAHSLDHDYGPKGGNWEQWPETAQVREMPEASQIKPKFEQVEMDELAGRAEN